MTSAKEAPGTTHLADTGIYNHTNCPHSATQIHESDDKCNISFFKKSFHLQKLHLESI